MFQVGIRLDIVCSLEADAVLPFQERMNVQHVQDYTLES